MCHTGLLTACEQDQDVPLASAVDDVDDQRHALAALPPGKSRYCTHCTGGWVNLTVGLEGCGKPRLYRDLIPGPSTL